MFDAGNTLVFLDPEAVGDAFRAASVPFDEDRFRRAELVARLELVARVSDGDDGTEAENWRTYFRRLLELSEVPLHRAPAVSAEMRAAHARRHLWTYAPSGVLRALRALRDAELRLAVVSNADGRMEDALEDAGVRDLLEFVIDSASVGVTKPNPAIFHMAAGRLDVETGRCLYVGDLFPVDVVGARRAGMRTLLVDPGGLGTALPVHRISGVEHLPGFLDLEGSR